MNCRGWFALLALTIIVAAGDAGVAQGASLVPGRFPAHQRFWYADAWTGWPVTPLHSQHPIRGSFLDPRFPSAHLHWGLDINVNDRQPEAGAPPGRSHRVYALEGGRVSVARDNGYICPRRKLALGHFSYWHVDPVVRPGEFVRPGQLIGWTCLGIWHLHLGEQAVVAGARVWVNPLHDGGKLRPYFDAEPPVIHDVRFYTPAMPPERGRQLEPEALRGRVDVRAWINDPQSFRGWMVDSLAPIYVPHHPYSVSVRLVRVADGRTWSWTVFRGDVWLGARVESAGTPVPFWHHYAPGVRQNAKPPGCIRRPDRCQSLYWLRLFAGRARVYWNTRAFANGRYRISIRTRDIAGNGARRSIAVAVAN